jgi:hypothetical protein
MEQMSGVDLYGDDPAPVRQLLLIGEADWDSGAEWPDYPASFGLDQQHVGALIRMACDAELHDGDATTNAVWAPLHAWRALGQLRAEASVQPLLALLKMRDDDDAIDLEFPIVFGMIGAAAIPHLAGFLCDRANSTNAAITALSALCEIAERYPDCRGTCIDVLVQTLRRDADADATVNGFAVSRLLDLKAVEAIEAIRDAFRRNVVAQYVAGDLEDVEIELGLREKPATSAPRYPILPANRAPSLGADDHLPASNKPVVVNKIGRNEQCPCGSGKKYKKCCLV